MNKPLYFSSMMLLISLSWSCDRPDPKAKIAEVMKAQETAWNNGDLRGFMLGYWMSDSLAFSGGKNITYGWQPALERYERSYGSEEQMGKLTFSDVKTNLSGKASAYTTGAWQLARYSDTLSGRFTLVWRRVNGAWVIVADHSS